MKKTKIKKTKMKCPVGKKRSCSLQLLPLCSTALRSTAELSEGGQGLAVPAWPSSRGRGCSAPQETSASLHTPQCKPRRPRSSSLQSCAGDGAAREQRVFWGKVSCAHSECLYRGPSALAWLVLAQVFEVLGGLPLAETGAGPPCTALLTAGCQSRAHSSKLQNHPCPEGDSAKTGMNVGEGKYRRAGSWC